MRLKHTLFIFLISALTPLVFYAQTPPTDAEINALVEKLGSSSFEERQAAREKLIEIGEPVRDAIEAATNSKDPEIATVSKDILMRLNTVYLTIRFLGGDGKPLTLQNVTLNISNKPLPTSADDSRPIQNLNAGGKTDEKGELTVAIPNAGDINFSASVSMFSTIYTQALRFQPGRHILALEFPDSGTVSGTVVNADNNDAPIVGATISIVSSGTSQNDGIFSVPNVPPGIHRINPRVNGYILADDSDEFVIVKSGQNTEVKVKLTAKNAMKPDANGVSSLNGIFIIKILKPDGSPLSEQPVVARGLPRYEDTDPHHPAYEAPPGFYDSPFRTDKDGKFKLSASLYYTTRKKITLFCPGYKPLDLGPLVFKMNTEQTVEQPLKLEEGAELDVAVTDDAGKPVADAIVIVNAARDELARPLSLGEFRLAKNAPRVFVSPPSAPTSPPFFFATDEQGVAHVSGLEDDDYAIVVTKDGCLLPSEKIVRAKKSEKAKADFSLAPLAPAKVAINVVDAQTGQPVQGAAARLIYAPQPGHNFLPVKSDSIVRPNAPASAIPGRAYLTALAPGYITKSMPIELKPGENDPTNIALEKNGIGSLTGKIVPRGKASLQTILGVIACRFNPFIDAIYMPVQAPIAFVIDGNGAFRAKKIEEGTWLVSVIGCENEILGAALVEIEKGKTTDVTVPFQPTGAVEVALPPHEAPRTGDRALLAEFASGLKTPLLQSPDFRYLRKPDEAWLRSDFLGVCARSRLPAGRYTVARSADNDRPYLFEFVREVTIKPGETTTLRIEPLPPASIEGKVTAAGGPFKIGLFALVSDPTAAFMVAGLNNVAPNAAFKFDGIQPGKYRVVATDTSKPAATCSYVDIEVKSGAPAPPVELKFAGVMRKFSGKALKGAEWAFYGDYIALIGENAGGMFEIMPDGTFEGQVPPGKYKAYRLGKYAGLSGPPRPVEIVIEEGKDRAGLEIP